MTLLRVATTALALTSVLDAPPDVVPANAGIWARYARADCWLVGSFPGSYSSPGVPDGMMIVTAMFTLAAVTSISAVTPAA